MQENLIKNAVTFLKNPKVANTDKEKLISFLKGKGLTDEDIKEAFRRVSSEPEIPKPLPVHKFQTPASASVLSLASKSLSSFPDQPLDQVRFLLLSNNQISKIPAISATLLEYLDLSHNSLSSDSFPLEFFSLHCLKSLNLSNNALTSLSSFSSLFSLERLNVGQNQITEIPDDFINLNNLTVLIVCNNKLKSIPKSLFHLSLSKLVLFGNPLPSDIIKASYESVSSVKALILNS